jgi:hypothetical protein
LPVIGGAEHLDSLVTETVVVLGDDQLGHGHAELLQPDEVEALQRVADALVVLVARLGDRLDGPARQCGALLVGEDDADRGLDELAGTGLARGERLRDVEGGLVDGHCWLLSLSMGRHR